MKYAVMSILALLALGLSQNTSAQFAPLESGVYHWDNLDFTGHAPFESGILFMGTAAGMTVMLPHPVTISGTAEQNR